MATNQASAIRQSFECAIIFSFAALYFYFFQFQSAYITSSDGYYHIKYAYLLRTEGFLSEFKWATLSLWKDVFSDKDFLYHVILIPFTFFDLAFGMKLATVLLASISATSFYIILRLNGVHYAWFWFLMLMISGAFFLYRINSPRPQVLSVLLALWSVHFILNNQRLRLAAISFIYCSAYTASFLPLVFSLLASLYRFFVLRQLEYRTPLASALGFVAGMIIHPYFPDNLTFFWVQNFYVLLLQQSNLDLEIAGEIKPMTTRHLLYLNTAVVAAYIAAFFTAMVKPRSISFKTGQMFFISLAMLALMAHSKRFAEYAIPTTLMFTALFFSSYVETWSRQSFRARQFESIAVIAFVLSVVLAGALGTYFGLLSQFRVGDSKYAGAADYIKTVAPKDDVIFTCDWDDAAELWYRNSDNKYLVFLDPTFMYYWSKDAWRTWYRTAHGLLGINTYETLKHVFKTKYGVCTADYRRLHHIIDEDPRLDVVYKTDKVYVFRVN